MSALTDVLDAHQWGTGACICGQMVCSHEDMAHHQAKVVADAGLAVIELVEVRVWDGPGKERYWRVDDTTVQVDKFNVATIHIDDDWDELGAEPDQLRRLAAALLAAANVAEQVPA